MTKLINRILDDYFSIYDHDTTEGREHTWIQPYRIDSPLKPQFEAPPLASLLLRRQKLKIYPEFPYPSFGFRSYHPPTPVGNDFLWSIF